MKNEKHLTDEPGVSIDDLALMVQGGFLEQSERMSRFETEMYAFRDHMLGFEAHMLGFEKETKAEFRHMHRRFDVIDVRLDVVEKTLVGHHRRLVFLEEREGGEMMA